MIDIKHIFVTLIFLMISSTWAFTQDERLRVGVAGTPPFIIRGEAQPDGISPDVWEELAIKIDRTFEYVIYNAVPESLRNMKADSLDVLIGPVSITAEREKKFDFTQPYFNSTLGIAYISESPSLWQMIKPLFSPSFFITLGLFLLILTTVGTLVWLAERRVSPDPFPELPLHGIGNGIWFALVTMTTVGYGDKAPQTITGRVVTGVWMVVALVSATSLVAGLISTWTVSSMDTDAIQSAGDIAGHKIAVVRETPAEEFVERNAGFKIHVDHLKAGIELLHNEGCRAFVFDRPQLQYHLKENPSEKILLSPLKYQPQGYGFVFEKESELLEQRNIALLELRENGLLENIIEEWLPERKDETI